jgi:tRNA (cytidine/uridine-2'-O-)-methyltransferase
MDYRDRAVIEVHPDLESWRGTAADSRVFALSGTGTTRYADVRFQPGDAFLFGPESVGLPVEIMSQPWISDVLRIPMQPGVRSLNLANSVAVVLYEAWRQHDYVQTESEKAGNTRPTDAD